MKFEGAKSLLIGYHSLIFHTLFVTLAWKSIYKKYPNMREFICILLHDIGYIFQDELQSKEDRHPELGAKICGMLFGKKYYQLCIGHSRDYASKMGIKISKLCYADKYCTLLVPIRLQYIISIFDAGVDVYRARKVYNEWWNKYGYNL